MSNVPLWVLLLETLRTHQGSIKFVKVSSHVNIIGNNEADRLADQGRLSHPLCPVFQTPERHASADETSTAPKRRRRVSCTDLQSISGELLFSPPNQALLIGSQDMLHDLALRLDPELLAGDWSPPLLDCSPSDLS